MDDVPAPENQPETTQKSLFGFGPPKKKARQSPEELQQQSIKDEFLEYFEAAIKNERNFAGFWAPNKKV